MRRHLFWWRQSSFPIPTWSFVLWPDKLICVLSKKNIFRLLQNSNFHSEQLLYRTTSIYLLLMVDIGENRVEVREIVLSTQSIVIPYRNANRKWKRIAKRCQAGLVGSDDDDDDDYVNYSLIRAMSINYKAVVILIINPRSGVLRHSHLPIHSCFMTHWWHSDILF